MNSRQLDCFIEVATHLSFSRAAENLFLTQSVVSYHISSLEQELGIQLLQRDTHSVKLTPAGESLYHDFLPLQEKAKGAVQKAQKIHNQTLNKLNIGWVVKIDRLTMGSFLSACRETLPDVQVNLTLIREEDIIPKIQNREFDIGFLFIDDVVEHPDLSFFPLFETHDYCWVNASHPLAARSHLEISDLEDEEIVFQKAASTVIDAMRVYNDIQNTLPDANLYFIDDYEETAIPMILANACVALAPYAYDIQDQRIVSIPFGHYEPMLIGFAWRKDDRSTNTMVSVDLIKKTFGTP